MKRLKSTLILGTIALLIIAAEGVTAYQFYEVAKLIKYKYDAINLLTKAPASEGEFVFFADGRLFKLIAHKPNEAKPHAIIHRPKDGRNFKLSLPCK